ncbi:EAL domain-containing protein [Pleomorphomonas sp. PLEO]|uniref:EAL domain-containing protein n=1 Tax=Pleomorphomonas sp. PLEO TaxID=3239306 RepID=UPI00351DFFA2
MSNGCAGCQRGEGFPIAFSMAFQPIVDTRAGRVFGHEALVRGVHGEGAGSVLGRVDQDNRYYFDQQCRIKAIELAARLFPAGEDIKLSINFMPNAVYEPRACIRQTLETAERVGFPLKKIIFEFTENEPLDTGHLLKILTTYKQIGFATAIDDFGAGYAGLNLLAKFQPDIVKLDMELVRGIDADPARRVIVKNILAMLDDLGVTALCEGVETAGEFAVLSDLGAHLFQGYHFAKPSFEALGAWCATA